MRRFFHITLILFLALIVSIHGDVLADTDTFAQLKKAALKIRNTDPHVQKLEEWKSLITSLERFANGSEGVSDAPIALITAARMRITVAEAKDDTDELDAAKKLLERVYKDYPHASVAAESLVLLGDIHLKIEETSDAEEYYRALMHRYPDSDLFEYAQGKLEQIDKNNIQSKKKPAIAGTRAGPLIVVDPGHGGEDLGAVGVSGLLEKDVVLDVALELEKILISELDARVVLTRTGDVFIPLQKRMELANELGADLFISLHTNASETKTLSGFESYYLDPEGDSASRLLAERENASGGGIDDISFMISDLIQASKIPESRSLADNIQKGVVQHLSTRWDGIKSLKVKKAPFYVLVGAHMPSVLIEMFFIDHPIDGVRLAEKDFRKNIAHGIFLGIKSYSSK